MDNISILKENIEKLLAQVERLKNDNKLLQAKAVAAEARAENAEMKTKELEAQLTSTVLSASIVEVAGGTKTAKVRLNRLIRDIDKCIAICSK